MSHPTTIAAACALSLAALSAGNVSAAGFQISETSVAGLGRAFAGAGVAADSAAEVFHNPAALMLRRGREVEFGLHHIAPRANFEDGGSTLSMGTMPPMPLAGRASNGGEDALVPNFYYAADLGKNARYGLSITSPFGLTTEYDADWVGRYHAIKSELITVEINPAVAYRVSETISIGGGITLIKADAELTQAQFLGRLADGRATVEGDDTAPGFTLGIVAGDENARIGLGYRSSVDLEIEGDLTIPGVIMKTGANANITLPATAYLSALTRISEKVDLLASVRWTDWSEFDELRIDFDNPALASSVTPENWEDSKTFAFGLQYRHNDNWLLRAGYAKDESPVKDEFRTARIPDTDRDWLAFGASYRASNKTRLDFSFARVFTDTARINEQAGLARGVTANLNGTYESGHADLFAIRLHFDLNQ